MTSGRRLAFALLACTAAAVACGEQPTAAAPDITTTAAASGGAPAIASSNGPVAVTVGQLVSYDAAKAGTTFAGPTTTVTTTAAGGGAVATTTSVLGLTYRISFEGASNGLASEGSTLTGQPTTAGVTWLTITATDSLGRTASDRFAIVAFAPGLGAPFLPTTRFSYTDAANPLPAHFRAVINGASVAATDNTPADNPITDAGATLGRVLFFDRRLSSNDRLSCAGCHSQSIAFGDTPPLSVGFAGGLTARHIPGLANGRFYQRGRFFWDERAATLKAQVLGPIQSPVEMRMTLDNLVAKAAATPYYPPLFQAAFGTSTVTSDRLARALAQYVRSLVSTNSKYDRAFTAAGAMPTSPNFGAGLTPEEIQGEQLFRSLGCGSCHATVSQVSDSVHNIGLDAVDTDVGAGRGAFKSPSLRNVAAHPRYMHDGRFTTLDQVVEFFNSGVQPSPDLDSRLKNPDGSPKRLGLTAAQKAALVSYLNTLTDSTFLTAARFANPFALGQATTPTPPTTTPPPVAPTPTPVTPATPATAAVTIQANSFRPATVTVAAGGVVTWTNLDNSRHGVGWLTAGPSNTPIFTSGAQRVTMPTTRGTYNYQGIVHGATMRGLVIVQ